MLKIGTVKWQGKCSRHPNFNPWSDGPSAMTNECPRCQDLMTIHENHQRTLRLMRTFSPPGRKKKAIDPIRALQQDLFTSNA